MLLAHLYAHKQYDIAPRYDLILDEVEDLCLTADSPLNTLMRKSGKFRLSLLLASQRYSCDDDSLGRLIGNCGGHVFFLPKDEDLSDIAAFTGYDRTTLANLELGECIAKCGFYSRIKKKNRNAAFKGTAFPVNC